MARWRHINVQCPGCGKHGYWPRLPKVIDSVPRVQTADGRWRTLWVLECQRCGHIWEYVRPPDRLAQAGVPREHRPAIRRVMGRKFLEALIARGKEGVDWQAAVREAEGALKLQKVGRDGVFVGDTLFLWGQGQDSRR